MSQDPDMLLANATAAFREGRLEEAATCAQRLLADRPDDSEARLIVGVIATKQGRLTEAVDALAWIVERDPGSYPALYWLSTALRRSGKPGQALELAQKAAALNGSEPQALLQLGLCLMDIQDWNAAEACLHRVTKIAPDVPATYYNLGIVFEALKRPKDATQAYRFALRLNPGHLPTLQRLGQILVLEADFEQASDCANRIIEIDPRSAFGHSLLAVCFIGKNRPSDAAAEAAKALELGREEPEALTLYGTILQSLGRMDESEPYLRRSVELASLQGYAYYALARTRKLGSADSELIEKMEKVVIDPALSQRSRGELEYALGKAYADLGYFQASMSHYDAANRMTREQRFGHGGFDRERFSKETDFNVRTFDHALLKRFAEGGLPDPLPIFVVGMMRSGTTLVEQILSCHPEIGAAGEQRFWMDRGPQATEPSGLLDLDRLIGLGKEYLSLMEQYAAGKSRVVDKMPGNYLNLGPIRLALPNARIVHIKRHPVDTCLSIWMTPNSMPLAWANDKRDVAFVYEEYRRMMRHWRELLPPDRLLEIEYEDLVSEPEPLSRRMIEFCGLPWDDRCLRPEKNERAVATPSGQQVRQPIYKSSVGRWQDYEPWLGPFLDLVTEDSA